MSVDPSKPTETSVMATAPPAGQSPSGYGTPLYPAGPHMGAPQPPYPLGQPQGLPPAYTPGVPYTPNQPVYTDPVQGAGYNQSHEGAAYNMYSPGAEDGSKMDEDIIVFTEKSVRLGFIKKVFGILFLQLLVTGGIMCMFMFIKPLKEFSYTHSWLYLVAIGVVFAMIIALGCCGDLRRKFPANMICLGVFTLAMSWMLGTIASRFKANEVLLAVGIVAAIVLVCCVLGFQTKIDFTWMVGILVTLTLCLIFFGIFAAIFRSRIAYIGYASLGAFIFSMWLIVDIQLIMGGKHQYQIDPEEYIFAALNLYIDIVNLLLKILILIKLLGGD